jgi:hypothetical protein
MKPLIRLVLLLMVASLASCATYYQAPAGDRGSLAVITSKAGKGIYEYESYLVEKMDGLPIHYTTRYPGDLEILLAPGSHRVTLKAGVRRGVQSVPLAVMTDFPFTAVAGRRYVTNGYLEGSKAVMWIEEAGTGKAVTEKKRLQLYRLAPQPLW